MGMIFQTDLCKKITYSFPLLQREKTTYVEQPRYKYYSTEDKVSGCLGLRVCNFSLAVPLLVL